MAESTAKISKIKSISPFWIVPIITAIIGVLLVVSHFQNAGYPVSILAASAEGIVAGKTSIKNRSVEVGIVKAVELSQGFDHVVLHCTINKNMRSLLKPDTVFWVARPRISAAEVTGLSTILAGVHIEVQPGKKDGEPLDEYTMLHAPPAFSGEPGLRVMVNSTLPYALAVHTPVQFSGFAVGHIEAADFDIEHRRMRYRLFIRAPYDALVTSNTRFWQKSGIDVSMTPDGLRVQFPSLSDMITGGIGFALPQDLPAGNKAADNDEYTLYANEKSIHEVKYTKYREYIMLFESSVGGLAAGAPVLFRGVRVGTVVEAPFIRGHFLHGMAFSVPVLIRIEPERISDADFSLIDLTDMDPYFTEQEIRGTLKTISLLSQSLYVDLDLYPDAPPWEGPKKVDGYKVIPTMQGSFEQLQQKIIAALNRFDEMPIEASLNELRGVLQEARSVAASLNKYLDGESARQLPHDLQRALTRLEGVLRNIQPLLDTLQQNSNALIFKVDPKPDLVPKAK